MYKQLETTKQEMVDAIEEMSEITGRVYLDRSKINRQIGKLQTLVKYLPNNNNYNSNNHVEDYNKWI